MHGDFFLMGEPVSVLHNGMDRFNKEDAGHL